MSPDARRGVTFVELVVALALCAVLAGLAMRALLTLSRHATGVAERSAVQAGIRTGMTLLGAELRELGGEGGGADLLRMSADTIIYRATRGHGLACALAPTQVRILDAQPFPFNALRAVAPGRDSLLLFVEGDAASSLDDLWIRLPVLSVGASTCGGANAIAIGTADLPARLPSGDLSSVVPGGPVYTFEVVRLAEYVSGGRRWLGAASLSGGELIQPVAGPLAGSGLTLEYLDGSGLPASAPDVVRAVRAQLVGETERRVAGAGSGGPAAVVAESLASHLFLRNAPR